MEAEKNEIAREQRAAKFASRGWKGRKAASRNDLSLFLSLKREAISLYPQSTRNPCVAEREKERLSVMKSTRISIIPRGAKFSGEKSAGHRNFSFVTALH